MPQASGSRRVLQDPAGKHLAGHPIQSWQGAGGSAVRGEKPPQPSAVRGEKPPPAQHQPHVPTPHPQALRQGNIILQASPNCSPPKLGAPFSLWDGKQISSLAPAQRHPVHPPHHSWSPSAKPSPAISPHSSSRSQRHPGPMSPPWPRIPLGKKSPRAGLQGLKGFKALPICLKATMQESEEV